LAPFASNGSAAALSHRYVPVKLSMINGAWPHAIQQIREINA
jgi:hypothetical protein